MRLTTLLILLAVVLLVAGGVWLFTRESPYDITNANPAGETIVAFGDSITYGTGASPETSYPAHLSRRLNVEIINKGVPGQTTEGGLRRLDEIFALNPRIVLLCLGGNDILRRVPPAETFENLEQIIDRLQARGALVILIGVESLLPTGHGGLFEELARRKGCPYVPHVLGGLINDPQYMADQVHPNVRGYERIAEKIEPVLRPYVESTADSDEPRP